MTAHELIPLLSDPEWSDILEWLDENDRAAYRAFVNLLASRRKLRPVFVERKPRGERELWMKSALSRKPNEDLARDLIQAWLLGAQRAMVCSFLDSLGIPHDGQGLVDEIPSQPPLDTLRIAFEGLVAKHPSHAVFTYMHMFTSPGMAQWPALEAMIAENPILCRSQPA